MSKQIPKEQLVQLWSQLNELSPRSRLRSEMVEQYVNLFGISKSSVYRQLSILSPINNKRADVGMNRITEQEELIKLCRVISALKIRTSNEKNTHLSTQACIDLLEDQSTHKTNREKVADEIQLLSENISVNFLDSKNNVIGFNDHQIKSTPFKENKYLLRNKLEAKKFVANYLGKPLSELSDNYLNYINEIIKDTLDPELIVYKLKQYTLIIYDTQEIKA